MEPNDVTKAVSFLRLLWPNDLPDRLLIWTLPDKTSFWAKDLQQAENLIRVNCPGADVYYGVGLTSAILSRRHRALQSQITMLPALFIDFDAKGIDKPELLQWIQDRLLQASAIVDTGNGYHAYWILDRPRAAMAIAPLLLGWQRYVQDTASFPVDSIAEPARVMRLPGTWNLKDRANPKPVELVYASDVRYDPSEFPEYTPPNTERKRELPDIIGESGGPLSGRDNTLFKFLCACRRFGLSEVQLRTVAYALNAEHLEPPLSEREVETKIKSALRYRQGDAVNTIQIPADYVKGLLA